MPLTLINTRPTSGVSVFTYDNLDSADTAPSPLLLTGTVPLAGFMQVTGTFGGGSVALQGSNDGTNWVALKDLTGTVIAITVAGGVDFSVSCVYIRPRITGGTGDDVDVTIALRG